MVQRRAEKLVITMSRTAPYAGSMRYLALATDYDGTLARHGRVSDSAIDAMTRFRKSGRRLVLVTGRELDDLEAVFPRFDLFNLIVAENGTVVYSPETREKRTLAAAPPPQFVELLKQRGVQPLSVGEVIVATSEPHEVVVLQCIRELGLELNVIFNKGAVMVLPAGVNKQTGLKAALEELALSEHNVVGVGDAENDHAFLRHCECAVAVSNALPSLKETVDLVTEADHGEGVSELIGRILEDDLASLMPKLKRHDLLIGQSENEQVFLPAFGSSLLISGASGSGKSTFTTSLVESLQAKNFQICLIDPEGDYEALAGTVTIGDEKHAPSQEQVLQALQKPGLQVAVNLVGLSIGDRPAFFAQLLPRLQEMRLKTGRPHWIVIDEAHHMLAAEWAPTMAEMPPDMNNIVLITVHPENVSVDALCDVNVAVAIGAAPKNVIHAFAKAIQQPAPEGDFADLSSGQAIAWFVDRQKLYRLDFPLPQGEHHRHKRKYAEGELGPDRSFYFVGPQNKLKLRAQNLTIFLQIAEGIDDETWVHHLKAGDYSAWFQEFIKDPDLAAEAQPIEQNEKLNPVESRREIKRIVESRYTAPADSQAD